MFFLLFDNHLIILVNVFIVRLSNLIRSEMKILYSIAPILKLLPFSLGDHFLFKSWAFTSIK